MANLSAESIKMGKNILTFLLRKKTKNKEITGFDILYKNMQYFFDKITRVYKIKRKNYEI